MAPNCPYCGHNVHSTAMYMTCEESSLCQQCGLSESDAWLRSQEDELIARFSKYSISQQVEQATPTADNKPIMPMVKHTVFASAAAHSLPVSPYYLNGNSNTPDKATDAAWIAQTDPGAYNSLDAFDMDMGCELETSDVATITTSTTDSKRSSFNAESTSQLSAIDSFVDHAEPYMTMGYEHDRSFNSNSNGLQDREVNRGAQLPTEPSTGSPYTPCKDPIYNTRSWWEYGGGVHDYRWDCLRERAL